MYYKIQREMLYNLQKIVYFIYATLVFKMRKAQYDVMSEMNYKIIQNLYT